MKVYINTYLPVTYINTTFNEYVYKRDRSWHGGSIHSINEGNIYIPPSDVYINTTFNEYVYKTDSMVVV